MTVCGRAALACGLTGLARRTRIRAMAIAPVIAPQAGEQLRFAELMACLAAACELAMGQSADFALQGCALAMRLALGLGLSDTEQRDVYYQAQLRFIGCNADTELMAAIAGDVIALRRAVAPLDVADGRAMMGALVARIRATHADTPPLRTALAIVRGLMGASSFATEVFPGHCEVAQRLGRRLGFDERFVAGLGQLYARWDGKGLPAIAGEGLTPAVRVVTVAQDALLHHQLGGWAAAIRVLQERRGAQYAPAVVDLLLQQGPGVMDNLPQDWQQLFALEPLPHRVLQGQAIDDALAVLADYAAIQSPWLLQHAGRVAALAQAAAERLQLPPQECRQLHRAALLHDMGRVAVSADVWGRPGPLSQSEWDKVRLHSHYSAHILARAPALAPLARLADAAHERLDGSGYARALSEAQLPLAARLLAAADVVAALSEARPQRAALEATAIEALVGQEVVAGKLDATAAQAVLAAAGLVLRQTGAPRSLPAGLTEREAQVLAQLARGQTNKQIARALGMSPKTAGHHIQAIYAKAGVRTRAGATLFAMEQGLL
jgi:HD-GYP domain-containing protein (c-di-GMP phosphodiesterase class II)/DNA-binding CsgD family transcriptional regulator